MFASLRCSVDRAHPSARHKGRSKCRPRGGTTHGGPIARIQFPPPASHTNPITATDRVPSDEQLGKPGNVGGPGNADDDYS